MSGPQSRLRNASRLTILRKLAETDGAVTAYELADQVGLAVWTVRQHLIRPARCQWIDVIQPASNVRKRYLITDKGRQYLADLAEEEADTRAQG